jgi:hypothetical protein
VMLAAATSAATPASRVGNPRTPYLMQMGGCARTRRDVREWGGGRGRGATR